MRWVTVLVVTLRFQNRLVLYSRLHDRVACCRDREHQNLGCECVGRLPRVSGSRLAVRVAANLAVFRDNRDVREAARTFLAPRDLELISDKCGLKRMVHTWARIHSILSSMLVA